MSNSKSTDLERVYRAELEKHIEHALSKFGGGLTLDSFAKYTSRQALTRFLARVHIFEKIKNIHGSIIECGVYTGQGLMSWAQLSSIYEPVGGVTREIFGFDTFNGFPSVNEVDLKNTRGIQHKVGDLAVPDAYQDLKTSIELFDKNRLLAQFPKVHLIAGDFMETSDRFFAAHPHVVPALLYLDFDIYEPTKKALEIFYPRMPKGSVIAFDEVNDTAWPGETLAMYEVLDIKRCKLEKIAFDSKISYIVVE
jgi:hypothetical protein